MARGRSAVLTAGSEGPSTFLHFFLVPAADLDRPVEMAPAVVGCSERLRMNFIGPHRIAARTCVPFSSIVATTRQSLD
jgi:hypothetical protein